ncbi:diguanylate cyclase (GGDEF) domain-containing protein [Agreia bicolorata]|uniref:Diguanylate cyclase (GGDEF) domain-containing protein n=1 Tax=Agreia bicolorata TaxID=110935 RepID=A0A1T4XV13_9MICO|nr:EAL domain-containing protein [Agreia bicolorata]SKA93396.1 diguanylate cyclase (GGDEF) domain-containing protein [Agreia bicolorata]
MVNRFKLSMFDRIYVVPFIVLAVAAVVYAISGMIAGLPTSWTLELITILGCVMCAYLRFPSGRVSGLPMLGVTVTLLSITPPQSEYLLSVAIWSVGLLISQIFVLRSVAVALYAVGISTVGGFAFVIVHNDLARADVWPLVAYILASGAYFASALLIEFIRARGRWSIDRTFGLSALSPMRVAGVVLLVAVVATIMNALDTAVIPWLERDSGDRLSPLVVLLAATLFLVIGQWTRFRRVHQRLSGVVSAAVDLPWATEGGLRKALELRAKMVLQAGETEVRTRPPEHGEIGSRVRLESGVDEYIVASRRLGALPLGGVEQQALTALAHMASETVRIQNDVDKLERRANSDPLTGLPNYGAFQSALIEANENRSYHSGIAVLFIDLDNFKKLNDSRGHHTGDELLKVVAARLRQSVGVRDFVSRIGGDEFVVILTELQTVAQSKELADTIIGEIGMPLTLDGQEFRPVVSAGLAFSGHREIDAQLLVVDADRSMLQVKRSRRQGGPAEGSSVSIASHRSTRTNDIVARAITEDRLTLAFQPIVSIDQGRIWAFEALVRYIDPELGPISPSSLVARAKSLGLMDELTRQIIVKAMDAAEKFYAVEPSIACMTVNLELGQISEDHLGPFIREVAGSHPNVSMCIELNERSLRSVTDDLRREAEIMQDAGVIIALDDYGSDDSSVGALVRFPMDILKIDKSLIDDLGDVRQREVIKALQGFGDNLDYTMIVEGIESPDMVDVMVELGVRSAQGYYFGRPQSFRQTMDRIRNFGTTAVIS